MSYNSLFGLGSHSPDASLQGWWKLDDNAASTVVTDYSGNGSHGTLAGGVNTGDVSVPGPGGFAASAISLNGTGRYISLPSLTISGDDATLLLKTAVDADPPATAGRSGFGIFGEARSSNSSASHYPYINGTVYMSAWRGESASSTLRVSDSSQPALDVWRDLCIKTTPGTDGWKCRIDDSTVFSETGITGLYTSGVDWGLGRSRRVDSNVYYLDGRVAQFSIFDRHLSDAEEAEANAGPEPLNLTVPVVSGTHETGQLLTATDGTWDSQANGTVTYTYQWQTATDAVGTGLTDIRGATASTWKLRSAQSGLYVRCLVSASNDGGVDTAEDTGSAWTLASGNALPSYNETFGLGTHDADPTLEGWWKMDDNAASTVITDYSGNGRHGTATANTNTLTAATNYGPMPNGLVSGTYTLTSDAILTSDTEVTFGGRFEATALSMSGQNFMKNGGANVVRLRVYTNTLFLQNYAAQSNEPYTATTNTPTSAIAAIDNVSTTTTQYAMVNGNTPVDPETPSGLGPYRLLIERVPDTIYYDMFCFSRYLAVAESQEVEAGPEPLNLTAPAVSGTHETGETLTTTDGTWDSQANGTVTYVRQWQRADDASGTNAANISGATASTYTLTASDENKYVRFTIASSNDGGNDAAEDQGTAWVQSTAGGGGPTFQPAWAFQATTVAL